jgi:hypothetical protein
MLPGELQAQHGSDPGYQNFLRWISAGGKHGTLAGKIWNEAVARTASTPWGENKAYDAAGNEVSMYRAVRPGEASPYRGTGPSAPEYDPARSAAMFVPDAFKAPNASLTGALGTGPGISTASITALAPSILAALGAPQETEQERQARLLKASGYGASLPS